MSRAAKLTATGATLFCVGTIAFVHLQQEREAAIMYQGVVRDAERMQKKRQRAADFEEQARLREWLERDQKVVRGLESGVHKEPHNKVAEGQDIKLKGCTSAICER